MQAGYKIMIWHVLKKSVVDTWDELLYAIIYNFIWVVGTLLFVTWPFVTFGLFYTAKDISDGKGIKFKKFFAYGRQYWKAAYIWGGINLGVLVLLGLNLNFYAGINTQWAGLMQLFFIAVTLLWSLTQIMALGVYPRLLEPSFKLALRNSAVIAARYPLMMVLLLAVIILMAALSLVFSAVILVLPFSFVAIFANNAVGAVLKREEERQEEADK
jgi:uncharacterized membrane protein YesL